MRDITYLEREPSNSSLTYPAIESTCVIWFQPGNAVRNVALNSVELAGRTRLKKTIVYSIHEPHSAVGKSGQIWLEVHNRDVPRSGSYTANNESLPQEVYVFGVLSHWDGRNVLT